MAQSFEQLGIAKDYAKALKEMDIIHPTEIQEKVIPILLNSKRDLVGEANTGTGKTAAYGLPLLHKIKAGKNVVQGLILCPTRELGQQIAKQLFKYTKYSDKIFTEALYGGEYIGKQISRLQRPTHIVVATPGRLIDLLEKKAINLDDVKTVILDEADEMLSMGFKKELEEILKRVPNAESRWLFSATMPKGIVDIVDKFMAKDAHHISQVEKGIVNSNISHQYIICEDKEKLEILKSFLKSEKENRGLIFCKTKAAAQQLAKQLVARNFAIDSLHGDLSQKERDKVMRAFKKKDLQFLVATDVAARGLDIEKLAFVVHYQLPESEEYFTHRSGRTARAGRKGLSLCLANTVEEKILKKYEQALGISFRLMQ